MKNFKKITSLSLSLSFLIMTYTGLMLFLCPHGRVAYWSDWHLFGLSKGQYGELHTTFMVLFLFFSVLHIYYNWKPLVSYLKNKSKKVSFTKKEFIVAIVINLVFVSGTLLNVIPFKTFLHASETIKDTWTTKYGEPPYGHAELSKFSVFCKKVNIDLEDSKAKLNNAGIKFKENQTLQEIAENNGFSPSALYQIIKVVKKEDVGLDLPTNVGRKLIKDLATSGKINLEKSIKRLKAKGLNDANKESKMKNLADELETTPLELYKELLEASK